MGWKTGRRQVELCSRTDLFLHGGLDVVEQVKSDRNNSGANGSQSSVCLCNNSSMPLVLKSTSVSTFPMVVMLSGFLIPECRETASTTSETAVSVTIALGVGTLFKSYRRWTSWQEKSRSFKRILRQRLVDNR